jgi:23S rRNA pseudouridine2605 synthase
MKKGSFSGRPGAGKSEIKKDGKAKSTASKPTGYRSKIERNTPDFTPNRTPRNESASFGSKPSQGRFSNSNSNFKTERPATAGRQYGSGRYTGNDSGAGFEQKPRSGNGNFPRKDSAYKPNNTSNETPGTGYGQKRSYTNAAKPYKWQQEFPEAKAEKTDKRPRANFRANDQKPNNGYSRNEGTAFGKKPDSNRSGAFGNPKPNRYTDKPRNFDGANYDKPKADKPYKWQEDFDNDKTENPTKIYEPRPFLEDRKKRNPKPYSAEKLRVAQAQAPANDGDEPKRPRRFDGPYQPNLNEDTGGGKRTRKSDNYRVDGRHFDKNKRQEESIEEQKGTIRLNRYIANSGICSRRDADELIQSGQITVNAEVITEMGHQVKPNDVVKYGTKLLTREKMVYVLVNKPKDFITTTEDPRDRKTVMHLVEGACKERIYPVGRLDRNTTGLLLLTNDGELASKLTHPSNQIEKVYQVEIDKPITDEHFQQILSGITLEDGEIKADELAIITPDAMVIGIKIHSGRNHIVRRIFAQLGYEVLKLDRTVFAGLNKKDLPRSHYRMLTEKEVIKLKYFL